MICPTCKGGKTLLKKVQGKGCYEVVLGICDRCHGTGEIEMTNEDFLKTATTKQLAEWLAFLVYEVCIAEKISNLQKMQNAKAEFIKKFNEVNSPCEHCGCNPKNGGSGLCNCTLACPKIT